MEYIYDHDFRLDPPDLPTHGECDGCGNVFDNGDLSKVGRHWPYRWLCDECKAGEKDDAEE